MQPLTRPAAELVAQLGGLLEQATENPQGLTAAQWSALRYFARANRFSRTASAFAEYNAVTRGTASQTVKLLVRKGLLRRLRCPRDGRSQRLEVTAAGAAALTADPLLLLSSAVSELGPRQRQDLTAVLSQLLDKVAGRCGRTAFGLCAGCRFCCRHHCRRFDEPLAEAELGQLCVNHQARD